MLKTTGDGNQGEGIKSIPIVLELHQGFSSVDGVSRSNAALKGSSGDGNLADERVGVHKNEISVSVDIEQFAQKLYVSQSVSASYFGNSVSGKMSYLNDTKRSTYSVSLCIRAFKVVSAMFSSKAEFLDPGLIPTNNEEANEFFMYYGDSYVKELFRGGEYIAVFTFYCSSLEMQEEIAAQVSASVTKGAAQFNSSTQASLNTYLREVKVDWSFHQDLTGIQEIELPQPEQCIDFALKFHGLELDAPSILYFTTEGYEHVPGMGDGFKDVKKNRKYFIGSSIVDGLAASLAAIDEAIKQIDILEDIYEFYGYTDPTLARNKKKATSDREAIANQMQHFLDCPTDSFSVLDLPSLGNGSPSLDYETVAYSPSWGGGGGRSFNDIKALASPYDLNIYNSYFQLKTRILSMAINTGKRVDRLETEYAQVNPDLTKTSSLRVFCVHGGSGGNQKGPYLFDNGSQYRETLNCMSGRSGNMVDMISITFGEDRVIAGGGNGGSPFGPWEPPAEEGAIVLGFYGRAGEEIDQIGLVYTSLKPAKWLPIP